MDQPILIDGEYSFLATRVTHANDPLRRGFLVTWDRDTDEFLVYWEDRRGLWTPRAMLVYSQGPPIPERV